MKQCKAGMQCAFLIKAHCSIKLKYATMHTSFYAPYFKEKVLEPKTSLFAKHH